MEFQHRRPAAASPHGRASSRPATGPTGSGRPDRLVRTGGGRWPVARRVRGEESDRRRPVGDEAAARPL